MCMQGFQHTRAGLFVIWAGHVVECPDRNTLHVYHIEELIIPGCGLKVSIRETLAALFLRATPGIDHSWTDTALHPHRLNVQ
jgi:hypothetical protein